MPIRRRRTRAPARRRGRVGRRRINRRRNPGNKISTTRIPRSMSVIGDRTLVKLTFIDTLHTQMTNVGQSNTNVRYRPTAAYDVDPIVGSTSTPGYNEYAAFYNLYRVHGFAYTVTFTNLEAACPVLAYCIPNQLDPGANVSYTTAAEWQGNPYFKSRQLSPKGGMDRCTIRGYIGLKKFIGSKTANYDDNYAAGVGAAPNNNIILLVGGLSQASAFTASGLAFQFKVTMYVEFFERKLLTA